MWAPFSIQAGMVSIGYLYLGVLCKKYNILNYCQQNFEMFACALIMWVLGLHYKYGCLFLVGNIFVKGIGEVAVSIVAMWSVLYVSYAITKYLPLLKRGFLFYGKNTLLILCLHIIELNLVPWWNWFHGEYAFVKLFIIKIMLLTIVVYVFDRVKNMIKMRRLYSC